MKSLAGAQLSCCQCKSSFTPVIFQTIIVGLLSTQVRSLVLFPSDITPTHITQYLTPVCMTHDRTTVVHVCVCMCVGRQDRLLLLCACLCHACVRYIDRVYPSRSGTASMEYAKETRPLATRSKSHRQLAMISSHTHRCS